MNKEFKTWLVLDYKTGKFRLVKKRPDQIKASDLPIELKLNVVVPETPILKATGEIKLSEVKATEMLISQVE